MRIRMTILDVLGVTFASSVDRYPYYFELLLPTFGHGDSRMREVTAYIASDPLGCCIRIPIRVLCVVTCEYEIVSTGRLGGRLILLGTRNAV